MSFFEELKRRNVFRVGIAYGVTAWVVLQFADLVMDNIEAPGWVMHVLMLIIALGFIVSLVIAWAYELTPEGIKRESEVDRDQSVTLQTAKKLHYVTLGAITVLIALLLAERFMPATGSPPEAEQITDVGEPVVETSEAEPPTPATLTRGVAVLPFANLSEDPNNAFFAGGVHEDILTNLSRIADLRVISRTSMLKIAEQGLDIREIGKQLDVSHVLEGSVRRAENQVRVTVQLIDASNDNHVWADNFDRTLNDIFAIQSEVAQKIASQLETEFSPEQKQRLEEAPTRSTEAYDLYVRAREMMRTWLGAQSFQQMLPLLEQAVALDANFLEAKVMLGMVYGRLVWTGTDPDGIYRQKAKIITDQILHQWPDRPESDVAEGTFHYTIERDYLAALFAFQRALPYMPNDTELLILIASAYKRLDQFELGLPVITLAESLDPQHPTIPSEKAFHLVGAGRYDEALRLLRNAVEVFPGDITQQITFANYAFILEGDSSYYLKFADSIMRETPLMGLYDPLLLRLPLDKTNLDQQIDQLMQVRADTDFWTARMLEIQSAELMNLMGREDESGQLAVSTLESIQERLTQNPDLGGNQPELDYAKFAYLACMANDETRFDHFARLARAVTSVESGNRIQRQLILGQASAECGNSQGLMSLVEKAGSNPFKGTTRWQFALDPLLQHYLADIPEYQEMVRRLQASRESDFVPRKN